MAERLLKASEYSLATRVGTVLTSYISHPDFDWDKNPNGAERTLPFAAVSFVQDQTNPAFMDEQETTNPEMLFAVVICGSSHDNLMDQIGTVQGNLRASTATASGINFHVEGYPGLPLLDQEDSDREVGVLEMDFGAGMTPNIPADETQWNNLKHSVTMLISLIPIYKQVSKDLL